MVRLVRSWMKHLLEFLTGSQHFLQGRTMLTISNRGPGIHPTSTDDANDTVQEEAPAGINGRQVALPRRRQRTPPARSDEHHNFLQELVVVECTVYITCT
ncbi:hypothetical protein H257_18695 [Aphanomyces astaci]|uniref:Uncharacterized protein n=1 Tax=Aphanomyces astaci TaxID=112090 RepID=W4FCE1_APHAT|nr:hypothetical protein H257_18695 [Aphanomyces astaci]ETV64398.1 hypothetical protein H257_18695 [Aphanomyces astaci]|eukprot:XP_009846114.1 hypothetical protein H257_18695 [Aphanomyces astaci]